LKLSKELKLFAVLPEAPGAPFFLPNGTVLYNELTKLIREKVFPRNYLEVFTPLILDKKLWVISGHWDHYKENMYFTKIDGMDYGIKPMNCPGHILVYKNERHSYRDLPIRISEFGTVHRHELSGVLNGLLRVRKFTQDDSHIFCTVEQVKDEALAVIRLLDEVYKVFGFSYALELSMRPEKNFAGTIAQWDEAEKILNQVLKESGKQFKLNPGEGAFYGPKIDFHIQDALGRKWQCGTIQLDFHMPEAFGAEYFGSDDKPHTPVMIHHAIFGSLDRFLGVLIEHYAGAFPLWLSPEQVRVLSVSDKFNGYADSVVSELRKESIRAFPDTSNGTVSYKVRDAQLQKVPLIIVVGEKEQGDDSVTIRWRSGELFEQIPLKEFISAVRQHIASRSMVLPSFK
ncbi:MAG: threonine--tRNA ligase, partial [Candidatus Diapherotrites archaeon]